MLLLILAMIILVVPLLFFPKKLMDGFIIPQISLFGIGGGALIIGMLSAGVIPVDLSSILAVFLLVYLFTSTSWSTVQHNSVEDMPLVLGSVGVYLASLLLFSSSISNLVGVALLVFAVSMAVSIYGIAQKFCWDPIFPERINIDSSDFSSYEPELIPKWFRNKGFKDSRPISTIGNTNFFGGFIVATLPFNVFLSIEVSSWFLIAIIINIVAVAMSRCRGAMLGIAASVLFFILFISQRGWVFDIYNRFISLLPVGVLLLGGLYLLGVFIHSFFLYKKTIGKRFHNENDPLSNRLSFRGTDQEDFIAHLRYRIRYWKAAFVLIAQKPFFGFGLRTYRKEVYQAQSYMHNKKDPLFMGEEYQTPQPREVHNDYIENFVEGGITGGLSFLILLGVVFYNIHNTFSLNITNYEFLLLSSVTASILAVMVHAFFFFPFRLAQSALMFWLSLAMLQSMSSSASLLSIPSYPIVTIFVVGLFIAVLWEGGVRPNTANYYFLKAIQEKDSQRKEKFLNCAVETCPKNSFFRTHMMIGYTSSFPDIAEKNALFAYYFYDGSINEWSMYANLGIIKRVRGKYDEALECFSNAINSNPRFDQAKSGLQLVWPHAPLPKRRLVMKQMSQEGLLALKLSQTEINRQQALMENVVLKEKVKFNIPLDWPFDTEKGVFLTPMEAEEIKRELQKGAQQ